MKMIKKIMLCVGIVVCFITLQVQMIVAETTTSKDSLLDKIKERGELVVGTSPDYAPMEFIDSSKSGQAQYVGSDIELAKYIADKLGVSLKISASSFDAVLANLSTGQIDLAITGLSYTPARAKTMEMSIGYNLEGEESLQGILIRKEDAQRFTSLKDFQSNTTIAVQSGSLQEAYVQDQTPKAKLQSVSSLSDAVELLKNGSVDAVAVSYPTGEEYAKSNKELQISQDLMFENSLDYAGNRVGAPLGETELIEEVNNIIEEVNEKGLYAKWINDAKKISDQMFEISATSFLGICVQLIQNCWPQFLQGLLITLGLAFVTVLFGTLLGGCLALIKLSNHKVIQVICNIYIELVRGTPLLLQLWLFVAIFSALTDGKMPMIASVIIALIINSSAYVSEIIRGGILSVDKGQWEAAKSLGMSNHNMMLKIIFPQAIKNILPSLGNEFVMMVKETSLASTFYVGELMSVNNVLKATTYRAIEPLVIVGFIYFVVTYSLSKLIKYMERRMSVSD